ncbi:MAG: hypothetical protein AMXMBFR58_05630 [Phycisphaerae bacterium]|nr:hypothetical protein [Phycisphaerales bacterium]
MANRQPHQSRTENPLKSQGQSKSTTRGLADGSSPELDRDRQPHTTSGKPRRPGTEIPADTDHPAQHGGSIPSDPHADPRHEDMPERHGVKNGPSPADLPSSPRTGTQPDRSGGPSRTGKTGEDRHHK